MLELSEDQCEEGEGLFGMGNLRLTLPTRDLSRGELRMSQVVAFGPFRAFGRHFRVFAVLDRWTREDPTMQ